jgi:hypothetical protein
LDKVVVLGTQSTTTLVLLFLDFSTVFNRFYKSQPKHNKGKESFYWKPLEVFKSSHLCPCLPLPWNRRHGELAGSEERRGRPTSGGKRRLGSPVVDGWRRIGPGCCRRAAPADRWWRCRECSNSGEDGDGRGQFVARAASLGSRGCAEVVGWLGRRAGRRARRRLSGGGRGRDPSSERAARADQQAPARATGGSYGVGSNTCWRGKAGGVEVTVRHPWRTAAARHPREAGPAGFIAVCKAVEAMAWAPS